ncbi:Cytochrome P450 [Macrophomina phaseolina MS6]|uniref:Cytochrome P450 n=1 Tax=Macrophomina phaseolina (strain MS6) TaxID=1126212 RepID=K2R2T7_MACPH|nr:Cytochrome P450 [Macrophomina phaseolina MS6]
MLTDINHFAPFALGIALHAYLRRTSIHLDAYGWTIVGLYLTTLATLFCHSLFFSNLSLLASAQRTGASAALFTTGLYASIFARRLLRLRSFPGPFLAKLSQFYALNLAVRSGNQFHLEVDALHRQYGDFVRIGPRHISINRDSAIAAVYGPPSRCEKGPWYATTGDDPSKSSLFYTRDMEVQRNRRRAWDRGFNVKALATYESHVGEKAKKLVEQLKKHDSQPANITAWANAFALDVMGLIGFGYEFDSLETGKEHPVIKGVHESMAIIGLLSAVPWLLKMLTDIPGATSKLRVLQDYCRNQVALKEKTFDTTQDPHDLISWLLKARHAGDRSAPPGKIALDEDARLIIIAGSDTTAAVLANALHLLATHPRVLSKLQRILDSTLPAGPSTWTYAAVKNIAYLDHVINEVLRLRPPVPSGLSRTAPPEGLRVDDVFVPAGTVVSVAAHSVQRDARYWEEPGAFWPERWEGLSAEAAPFLAFSRGATNCAGKQFARMELRSSISQIALAFDLRLAEDGSPEAFDKGQKDTFTLTLPPLNMIFEERKPGTRSEMQLCSILNSNDGITGER